MYTQSHKNRFNKHYIQDHEISILFVRCLIRESWRGRPALMASFPLKGVINSFPIFAITINKQRPGPLRVPQQLLMLFSVNLRLGTFFNHNPSTSHNLRLLGWRFRVTNRSHVLQSVKTTRVRFKGWGRKWVKRETPFYLEERRVGPEGWSDGGVLLAEDGVVRREDGGG